MLLPDFAECTEKWASGAPIYVNATHGTITFYLRRWGTPESEKVKKDIVRSIYGPLHSTQEIDINLVYAHWLAEYGITGWENIDPEDSPYSINAARDTFLQREHFYSINQHLINQALDFENYLQEEAEEAAEEIKKS